MGTKLLVRTYNVGCGDCTYVRIPNDTDGFHILIDCGSKESASTGCMRDAIKHMEDSLLPSVPGETWKRLDLLVVSHRHEDHIKGFNPRFFDNILIENIWLSAAMDESHPNARRSMALHRFASQAMKGLADSGAALSPELADLVGFYGIGNSGAMDALTKDLPEANGSTLRYVHAGDSSTKFGLNIAKKTTIRVLAPELDIDGYYLGEELDANLKGMQGGATIFREASDAVAEGAAPKNIGATDFRTLQSRLLSNALAFAVDDSSIQNNVSTVILIEWGKRRLLFVGDAEWEEREFELSKKNGSWNVMWNRQKRFLDKPIDFLKVGHHGSHNATPWNRDHPDHEVNKLFDAILPLPGGRKKPSAQCTVSTKRKQYKTIPDAELLVELGKRVKNTRNYMDHHRKQKSDFDPEEEILNYSVMKKYAGESEPRQIGDKGWLDKPQPIRTDLESVTKGRSEMPDTVEYVDVLIDP